MKLKTEIRLPQQESNHIDYNSKVLLLGSCFVENIGEKLEYFKFQNTINPFGILFHPKAIEKLIDAAVAKKTFLDSDIFSHQEQWHSFHAHSRLSKESKEDFLQELNGAMQLTNQKIEEATHIILTLGTSWVYRHIESNAIVANCHKVSQNAFEKQLLSVDSISTSLENMVANIRKVNTKASIIFTVSPVRHIKDGFVENTLSKAHLVTAIHKVISTRKELFYFPSYEIMMDELRDYRFYDEDMLHPNRTAIQYIWERFKHVWIDAKTEKTMSAVDVVQKGLLHKPFHAKSEAHHKFLEQLQEKQNQLQASFSHIVF